MSILVGSEFALFYLIITDYAILNYEVFIPCHLHSFIGVITLIVWILDNRSNLHQKRNIADLNNNNNNNKNNSCFLYNIQIFAYLYTTIIIQLIAIIKLINNIET
ncbi:unnamed protein product [Rhizophagus irregularis]|nr:unnamed protein product [Rhizophagus irregularis]